MHGDRSGGAEQGWTQKPAGEMWCSSDGSRSIVLATEPIQIQRSTMYTASHWDIMV